MKKIYKIILLTCISTTSINMSKAQGLEDKFNINASVGLHFFFNANVNFEYRITDHSYISLGYGDITNINISHIFLKGRNNHYFEFGYGLTDIGDLEDFELHPSFRLGYRKINEFNSRFFRTGISIPEGLYFGFGRSF
jgi:hypothetical protein